ncbi:hypothetical protein LIA77_00998 [Sarocladium implicatum]|nr:hypothetical protein LIA77_00998 [Sarocladium implicatum]
MKSFTILAALITTALAAPATPLLPRQTNLPNITEVQYRVSNLEDLSSPKWVDTSLTVNGGAINWDTSNDLVGACDTCLNTGGHVLATRIDILSDLTAIHCNLYNEEKHVIWEFNSAVKGGDFDGLEKPGLNKAVNADKYSLLCYYV